MVIALLFVIILISFSIPFVQTNLAHRLTDYLNTELGTDIKIEKVNITFDFQINAKNVFIADHYKDTLIASESLKTSLINLPGLLEGKNIDFGSVTATHLTFRLKRYVGDDKDSFGIFLDKLDNKHPSDDPTQVQLTHLNVIDSKFSFIDHQGRYPEIISLDSLNIDASQFIIKGGDISVDVNKLSGREKRGVDIEDLRTQFRLRDDYMNFDEFSLVTAHSVVRGVIHFLYEETMNDFENNVQVEADFEEAHISTSDLVFYHRELGRGQLLNFTGGMRGVLNDFTVDNLQLSGLTATRASGRVTIKNIFGENPFYLGGDFRILETNYRDLIYLLPGHLHRLPPFLQKLGNTRLTGSLATEGGEMVRTQSTVFSDIGEAELDVVLSNLTNQGEESYEGELKFKNFNFGELLDNPEVGEADFDFNIKGKGFTRERLNTFIDGTFSRLEFKGYTYRDINIKGELNNPIFNGKLESNDVNFRMTFDGLADVSGQKNNYDFKAHVDYADLYVTNFIRKDSTVNFKGDVAIKMNGRNIDDVEGDINLENVAYRNRKGIYNFNKLNINSSFSGKVRTININSPDIVNGQIKGYFFLSQVPGLFKNAVGNLYSKYTPVPIEANQYLSFDIAIYNKAVEALFPDIGLSPNTTLMGSVKSSDSNVKINFNAPKITIRNNKFENVAFRIDNNNPNSSTYLNVEEFTSNLYHFSKLNLTSNRRNDTLYVQSGMIGGKNDNDKFDIRLYHTINEKNESVVGVLPSHLTFKNNQWALNRDGKKQTFIFDNDLNNLTSDTITLQHENQKIYFNGFKRGSTTKDYELNFVNVDLDAVLPYIEDMSFEGLINGELKINQQEGIFYPSSNLKIEGFTANDLKYGNLSLNINGNNSLTSYTVKADLGNDKMKFLTADGRINVDKRRPRIAVGLDVNQLDISLLNTFGKEVISNIRGQTTGHIQIDGDYRKPNFTGLLRLHESGLKIPYLNVNLALAEGGEVKLRKQEFYFDHIDFTDTRYRTQGQIDGVLAHNNFKDWTMDLQLEAPERLLVLDTDDDGESLYYGEAFIRGRAHFHGPFDELVIDASASSEQGTNFKIPLSNAESIADNQYIYFLTPDDKIAKEEGKDIFIKKIKGLEMNFDLDINDKANIEIVIDKKNGSTLKGSGSGTLQMEINTTGKFNMWGDFEVRKGVYDFKYAGLVEKDFEVVPGGTVTWDGNPLQANLNVRALYKAEANPASLLENPTINRNIPVHVFIDLNGLLSDVDIKFELEYPNLSSVVKSELEYRISDRRNTELQAMSLITQNSFYNDMSPGNTAHPENILLERAAGLFNDILSNKDDIFRVGVNYTKGNRTPEQDISDRVGLTLSTNVSDRILINGKVGVPLGGLTRSVVVGDLEMEFLLNEEGNLRAKIFNRESDIQYIGEELGYTQGIGLTYSVDFDTFKELIHKIIKREEENLPVTVEKTGGKNSSLVPDYIRFPGN